MVARPIAIVLCVLLCGCLPPAQPTAVNEAVSLPPFQVHVTEARPPYFGNARPCLIDTQSCLELAPAPFAPCLAALERCNPDGRLELLVGPNPESQR
jgi:hypothetical protein